MKPHGHADATAGAVASVPKPLQARNGAVPCKPATVTGHPAVAEETSWAPVVQGRSCRVHYPRAFLVAERTTRPRGTSRGLDPDGVRLVLNDRRAPRAHARDQQSTLKHPCSFCFHSSLSLLLVTYQIPATIAPATNPPASVPRMIALFHLLLIPAAISANVLDMVM